MLKRVIKAHRIAVYECKETERYLEGFEKILWKIVQPFAYLACWFCKVI